MTAAHAQPSPPVPRSFRLSSPDGLALHVREWGPRPHADTCLLVHGFADGAHVWNDFATRVPAEWRLLAPDLRGHGDSDWDPDGRYGTTPQLADLAHTLETLGIGRHVVIGHSIGGHLALLHAAAHPDRVGGVVLVDSGPELQADGVARVRADYQASLRVYRDHAAYLLALATARPLTHPALLPSLADGALRPCPGGVRLKSDPALIDADSLQHAHGERLWSALASLQVPVLLVRGIGSGVISRDCVREMSRRAPHLDVAEVPGAGHAVMADNPDGFARAVMPFLERIHHAVPPPAAAAHAKEI